MKKLLLTSATAFALALPAMAETAAPATMPTAGGVSLSSILQKLEAEPGFVRFDEVDWDNDGYWKIEYIGPNNAETTVKIDGATGDLRLR